METSKMKNIVVLKNLPSNIVDEAIVILKQNKKIKKLEHIEKNQKVINENNEPKSKEYILKEAEMLVSECMEKSQKSGKKEILEKHEKLKYKRLKKYSIVTTIALFVSLIMNLI